jgi:hypothetical protein
MKRQKEVSKVLSALEKRLCVGIRKSVDKAMLGGRGGGREVTGEKRTKGVEFCDN